MTTTRWEDLSLDQQLVLLTVYQIDHAQEVARQQAAAAGGRDPTPAAVWRWLLDGPMVPPSALRARLQAAALGELALAAAWAALDQCALIERRADAHGQWWVKLTLRGRAVAQVGAGISPLPRRMRGQLRQHQWAALVDLVQAGTRGLVITDRVQGLGSYEWTYTLLPLRTRGFLVEFTPPGCPGEQYARVSPAGLAHYRTGWAGYRALYPQVVVPALATEPLDT